MTILCWALQAVTLLVFARIVLEWIPVSYDHPVARIREVLRFLTEPLLGPMRRLIPPLQTGSIALDLSPLIVILVLSIITSRLC